MPSDSYRDLRGAARPSEVDDVLRAYGAAGEALDAGDVPRAMELLTWAKSAAPRSWSLREALGVAKYHSGDYAGASAELLAYRRLHAAQDQNHLLADCARALGRPEKVAEYVRAMDPKVVGGERYVEGLIVWASDRADRDDLDGALAVLRLADLDPVRVQPYHPRLWYVAADLYERKRQPDTARDYFEAITAVDDTYLDVDERLARLDD